MSDVVVLGDIVIDIVARLESYPPPGGDAQSTSTAVRVGGTSLNSAIVLARLGMSVAMLGRVGADVFGDLALSLMAQNGLRTDWVERDPTVATALAYIAVTPDGQRTMLGGAGANRNLSGAGLSNPEVRSARWLHLTSYNVMASPSEDAAHRAAGLFAARAAPISIDIGSAPVRLRREALARLSARSQIVMPSESTPFDGEQGQWVVRKCGARGCELTQPDGKRFAVPGFVVDVVDTTGAGDAFDGGYIAGRLRGLDQRASALLANACGAAACTVVGAGDALPPRSSVAALLRERAPAGWQAEAGAALEALAA